MSDQAPAVLAPDSVPDPAPVPARRSPRTRRLLRSPHEARMRRRRLAGYTVFGLAFVLMVNALLGENGYVATVRAEREYAVVAAALAAQRRENEHLLGEIRRLRDDPAALEEAARRLGMIRPGETLIVVKDARPAPPSPDTK
jgi:cell division protein FtsB